MRKPYLTKTVKDRSRRPAKVARLVARGWEIVSSDHLGLTGRTLYTLRKPNPKYREGSK